MYIDNYDAWAFMSSGEMPPDAGMDAPAENPGAMPLSAMDAQTADSDTIPLMPPPSMDGDPGADPPDASGERLSAFPRPPILGAPEITPDVGPVYTDEADPGYCTVRFLNSASNYSVGIRIGALPISSGVSFGGLTGYSLIPDGFRTVRLTDENRPSTLYLQKSIPFRAGDIITLVIVRTASGLDLVQVSDTPCRNLPGDMACIRMSNMTFNSPGLDLILDGNKLVFTDVRYKETTMFKQARPKRYRFSVAATINIPTPYESDIETIDEMPRLLPAYILGLRPAVTFTLNAKAGLMYTIYIMGSWSRPRIKIVVNQS